MNIRGKVRGVTTAGGVVVCVTKTKDVNLNFILHVYGTADQSGMWGFKGVGEGVWVKTG